MSVRTEKITFEGSHGKLAARLDQPPGTPRAYALFAHCFTCSKDIFAAARIAEGLTRHGIAVFRFDFTGLGASDGDFANTNFTSNIEDLLAAVAHMRKEFTAPEILIGHSLGGAAILAAAGDVPEARAIVTIGAPCDPGHVADNFGDHIKEIRDKGVAEVTLAGRPFRIQKQFLDDIESQDQKARIAALRKPLLILHAPQDEIVGIESAGNIFMAAKHPKSYVSLDDADHLLTRREDAEYAADLLAAWASRYLSGAEPKPAFKPSIRAQPGDTLVIKSEDGKFTCNLDANSHDLISDEPFDYGGNNLGPSPYDYLLASLGACTVMTIKMYADRKKLPITGIAVKLRHDKIHAKDCETCETTEGKIDLIERELEITGDLTADQRQRLTEIADMCPVHRTLHSEIRVETTLTKG